LNQITLEKNPNMHKFVIAHDIGYKTINIGPCIKKKFLAYAILIYTYWKEHADHLEEQY
jgi:hypothetical protein